MQIISFCKKLVKRSHNYVSQSSIKWFGSGYGGFYLDTSLLNTSSNLISFGVGEDISFDLAVFKHGVKNIYLFDPTPKSVVFIKAQNLPSNFHFYPVGLSDQNQQASFFLPKNDNNVSGSLLVHKNLDSQKAVEVQLKKLSTIKSFLQLDKIDILKMDIEGSEYKVIKNIFSENIFPVQICVEFHNDFFKNGKQMFNETMVLLKENKYSIEAVSRSGKEMLFVKK